MVEQVLNLDLVPARQLDRREQVADAVAQVEAAFAGELVHDGGDHDFADRADLEQGVGRDRRPRIGIREAEVQHRPPALGRDHAEGHAGEEVVAEIAFAMGADRLDRGGKVGSALRQHPPGKGGRQSQRRGRCR